jgi:hypothetical protein
MTTYAYDPSTTTLLAVREAGLGCTARPVTRLHARTPERLGLRLAQALTWLSTAAWLSYTDPGLVEIGYVGIDAPATLRALRRPHLPRAGFLYREGEAVLECANGTGRELVEIGSAGVVRAVVADVVEELKAVEGAIRGDLSGRSRQAVALTRLDASPVQIAAADRLLYEVPMGNEGLFTEVEPTAAAVAAVHWMQAAVDVTVELAGGGDPLDVLAKAAASEGFDLIAPGAVLGLLRSGHPPLAVVQNLVRSAMLAAKGMILHGDPEPCLGDPDGESRFTLLDPRRPALALLEVLTRTVQICGTVYADHCVVDEVGDWSEITRDRFDDAVRRAARKAADRMFRAADPCP